MELVILILTLCVVLMLLTLKKNKDELDKQKRKTRILMRKLRNIEIAVREPNFNSVQNLENKIKTILNNKELVSNTQTEN